MPNAIVDRSSPSTFSVCASMQHIMNKFC